MLAQKIRENTTSTKELNLRTKSTKFSSLFQDSANSDKDPEMIQILMKAGLMNVKEDDEILNEISNPEIISDEIEIIEEDCTTFEDEISEYIVEDPNEMVVNFPIAPVIELEEKLPFFKSLTAKLENLYCTIEPAQC